MLFLFNLFYGMNFFGNMHLCVKFADNLLFVVDQKPNLIFNQNNNCLQLSEFNNNSSNNLPQFPLHTVRELKQFSNNLRNDTELQKYFKKKILKIGGSNSHRHLTNVLTTIITNKLGKEITWTGQRQTQGIKNTPFAKFITETIQNHYDVTLYKLERTFSQWIRRSGDRYRYHMKSGRET